MIFYFFKYWLTLGMRVWYKRVFVHYDAPLPTDAPIVFASTHPNSGIDYLFSPLIHHQPTFVLVRGDVFEKPLLNKIFRAIFMLPVYRFRDGFASLNKNEQSFKECYHTFDENGKVLIFSEGVCVQEKVLQPIKKGTARLALDYLHKHGGKKIYIVTQAISYSRYRHFRDTAMVNFGHPINASDYNDLYKENPNKAYEALTADISAQLEKNFIIEKNYSDDSLTEKALMALRLKREGKLSAWSIENRSFFDVEKALVDKMNALGDNALSDAWKSKASELNLSANQEGLLSSSSNRLNYLFKLVLLSPFVVLFWLSIALPHGLTNWLIKNKIKDIIFHNTITVIGGVLFYLIQILILLIIGLSSFGWIGVILPILMVVFTSIGIEIIDESRLAYYNWKNLSKKAEFESLYDEVMTLVETN